MSPQPQAARPPNARADHRKHVRRGLGFALAIAAVVLLWGCSKPGHGTPHPDSPAPAPTQPATPGQHDPI